MTAESNIPNKTEKCNTQNLENHMNFAETVEPNVDNMLKITTNN